MIITTALAVWGALLSTMLFVFKVYELRKNSFKRLKVEFHADDFNNINTFTIVNYSNNPVNISYYDVFYANKKSAKEMWFIDCGLQGDLVNIQTKPYEKCDLSFNEDRYFSSYHEKHKGKKLFIKLWIVGKKKPIVKKVITG